MALEQHIPHGEPSFGAALLLRLAFFFYVCGFCGSAVLFAIFSSFAQASSETASVIFSTVFCSVFVRILFGFCCQPYMGKPQVFTGYIVTCFFVAVWYIIPVELVVVDVYSPLVEM